MIEDNYITQIEITNLKGIESMTMKLGRFLTIFHGENGAGKTSRLDGLRAAFAGGHRPHLIRKGQKKALVVLALKSGHTIEKHITESGTRTEIRGPNGQPVEETDQVFIEKLARGFAFDPLGLLKASKQDRAKYVAEATALDFTKEEIQKCVAGTGITVAKGGDLADWKKRDKDLREQRRIANGFVDEKEKTIKSLSAGIEDGDVGFEDVEETARLAEETHQRLLKEDSHKANAMAKVATDELAEINKKEQVEIDLIKDHFAKARATVQSEYDTALAAYNLEQDARIADAATAKATARERARQHQRAEGSRATLKAMREQLEAQRILAKALDAAVKAHEQLKLDKTAQQELPCKIHDDGDISQGGIMFDDLNKAKQINLCLQLGALSAGGLNFMVMDELEAFSSKTMKEFEAMVRESGFQILGARVSDDQTIRVEVQS